MATSTENFKFKKPDESDFYDVQDQNGNWDIADQELEKLNNPTFEDYTGGTSVPAASAAIEELKSKSKLGALLSNIKAAFKGACLIGHIVNNCVTDRSDLPLSAAQGKALMDAVNVLNTNQKNLIEKIPNDKFHTHFLETSDGNQRSYVLNFLKTAPNGINIIYVAHSSVNAYICLTTVTGTYGTILELGYNWLAITGAKGDGWSEWKQITPYD